MTILKNKDNSKSCMSVNKSIGSMFWRTTNVSASVNFIAKNVIKKRKKKPDVVLNYEMQQLKKKNPSAFNWSKKKTIRQIILWRMFDSFWALRYDGFN